MTRAIALAALLGAFALAAAWALTAPRLAPTDSGFIDRTNKTDRDRAPIVVASGCGGA